MVSEAVVIRDRVLHAAERLGGICLREDADCETKIASRRYFLLTYTCILLASPRMLKMQNRSLSRASANWSFCRVLSASANCEIRDPGRCRTKLYFLAAKPCLHDFARSHRVTRPAQLYRWSKNNERWKDTQSGQVAWKLASQVLLRACVHRPVRLTRLTHLTRLPADLFLSI
jgi:hypothetical protein